MLSAAVSVILEGMYYGCCFRSVIMLQLSVAHG